MRHIHPVIAHALVVDIKIPSIIGILYLFECAVHVLQTHVRIHVNSFLKFLQHAGHNDHIQHIRNSLKLKGLCPFAKHIPRILVDQHLQPL